MAITPCIGRILLALVLAPAAVACTSSPAPTPSMTATADTPFPTPTALTSAKQDLVNAEQAVVNMWVVVDRLTNDPQASLQDLDAVASGEQLLRLQENLMTYRAQGWEGSGASIVEREGVQLAGTNAEGLTEWTVTSCVDRSQTALVDAKGEAVQFPPYRIRHQSTVIQRAGRLVVDSDEATGTC